MGISALKNNVELWRTINYWLKKMHFHYLYDFIYRLAITWSRMIQEIYHNIQKQQKPRSFKQTISQTDKQVNLPLYVLYYP